MKSNILHTSIVVIVLTIFVAGIIGIFISACIRDEENAAANDRQCKAMCGSGIIACIESADRKLLIVDCSLDAGHRLEVQEKKNREIK